MNSHKQIVDSIQTLIIEFECEWDEHLLYLGYTEEYIKASEELLVDILRLTKHPIIE